jgi:type III pantothenate kinase
MLLTIDIGNTNIVLGGFKGEELAAQFRLTTQPERTADEYGVLAVALFARPASRPRRRGDHPCSVVPPLTPIIESMARERFRHVPPMIEPGVKTGMPILYENPHEVGADRIVNGVAAFARYGGPAHRDRLRDGATLDTITAKGSTSAA